MSRAGIFTAISSPVTSSSKRARPLTETARPKTTTASRLRKQSSRSGPTRKKQNNFSRRAKRHPRAKPADAALNATPQGKTQHNQTRNRFLLFDRRKRFLFGFYPRFEWDLRFLCAMPTAAIPPAERSASEPHSSVRLLSPVFGMARSLMVKFVSA